MSLRLRVLIRRIRCLLVSIVLTGVVAVLPFFWPKASSSEWKAETDAWQAIPALLGVLFVVFALLGFYSVIRTLFGEWGSKRKWKAFEKKSLQFWEEFLRAPAPVKEAQGFVQWCRETALKIPHSVQYQAPAKHVKTYSQALGCDSRVDENLMRSVASLMVLQKLKALNVPLLPGLALDQIGQVKLNFRIPIVDDKDFFVSVGGQFTCVRVGNVVTATVITYPMALVKRRVRASNFQRSEDAHWLIRRPWIQSDAQKLAKEFSSRMYALPFAWVFVLPSLLVSILKNYPFSNAFIRESLSIASGQSVDWAMASSKWSIQERFGIEMQQRVLPLEELVFRRMVEAINDLERAFALLAAELA